MTLFQQNNNTFINKNYFFHDIEKENIKSNNTEFFLYFLDDEESIINLVLNKSLDSVVLYNYLIITPNNISKTFVDSLIYQIFSINKYDYISIIELINNTFDKEYKNISINLYIDNTDDLIPYKYISYSKYIPLISIIIILIINWFFFRRKIYYNLCFNSSLIREIISSINFNLIKEKLKYNKIRYEYMSIISVDTLIYSLINFINDIYLSFIFTSIIFIINNNEIITHFFNSNERTIKKYFFIFLSLSIINIPNYLSNNTNIFLILKIYLYEIFKIYIFMIFIREQINHISYIISLYSFYRLVNGINILKYKKIFLFIIKYIFIMNTVINIINFVIYYIKYRNNTYYWDVVIECIVEWNNSFIIFFFSIILNINEYNNQVFNLFFNKGSKKLNCYKYNNEYEITNNNYKHIKNDNDFNLINNAPIIVLHPLIKRINNNNFEKINIGIID